MRELNMGRSLDLGVQTLPQDNVESHGICAWWGQLPEREPHLHGLLTGLAG